MYLQEFSVAAKEAQPRSLFFKPDGTKLYIIGIEADLVNEYDLGTQWDVTSAVWLQGLSVAAKELEPNGLCFKPDGTKLYTTGFDGDTVDEYDLGTQWDISTAVYRAEFSVVAEELTPMAVCFKPDGTKMYIVGDQGNKVYEYDLGTPWDVTTAVYLQGISVAAKETNPQGLYFKPDGTKMYTVGYADDSVDEYDLGTQWDVTTAVYRAEISIAAKDTFPRSVCFKPDGTKMFTVGSSGKTVDEYDL